MKGIFLHIDMDVNFFFNILMWSNYFNLKFWVCMFYSWLSRCLRKFLQLFEALTLEIEQIMKPSYFQNARIEETFERQCNCESRLNKLLWNEFLIITLPLVCWSSPRLREWPGTHSSEMVGLFFSFAAYHLEYSETKLFCFPWNTPQKQFFTRTLS